MMYIIKFVMSMNLLFIIKILADPANSVSPPDSFYVTFRLVIKR